MGDEYFLKRAVAAFWDRQPCGAFASDAQPGQRRFYEQVAGYRYATQPYMRAVVGFDRYPGQRVLEVGCGLGTDLRQFALGDARVVGLDLSFRSVRLARQHFATFGTPGSFCQGDSEILPFGDGSFDTVYAFGVLHHTPDTQQAINECWRVLRPGGEFIVMLYNRAAWAVRVDPYLRAIVWWLKGRVLPPRAFDPAEVVRRYDGVDNPLSKAYTAAEVQYLLRRFEHIHLAMYDSYVINGSRLAHIYNRMLRRVGIYRRWGFFIIARAIRPECGSCLRPTLEDSRGLW